MRIEPSPGSVRAYLIPHWPLAFLLLLVLIGPVALRPGHKDALAPGDERLVIITPHNEAIRAEFGRGFAEHLRAKTGRRVRVDFRSPGGTSEIARYVGGEYLGAFQHYWTSTLGRPWSSAVERSFANPGADGRDPVAGEARRAFLSSNVGCKIDLFFGGGAYDFQSQAKAGYLVDSGFVRDHPELFNEQIIPQQLGGEPLWDPEGRWIGACLSAFGIVYNTDSLRRLGIDPPPARWADLADPRFLNELALANPTQSGSVTRSFEMLIQQQMREALEARRAPAGRALTKEEQGDAIGEGWNRAMQLLMKIGANARYFTDAASKISIDVAAGEAAAGMSIDFFGRFQSEAVARADGASRLVYAPASGGSSMGADPIGVFRGAPSPELAREFIAFVLSSQGQKLWNWKVGTPGGPSRYAVRRLPILPSLYAPEFAAFRSDPDVDPYAAARDFEYHEQWTAPLFRVIALVFRAMCIDPHDELSTAWEALISAGFPAEATSVLLDVSPVNYAAASGPLREALGPNKIREVQLARNLADRFRDQYRRAAGLARERRR